MIVALSLLVLYCVGVVMSAGIMGLMGSDDQILGVILLWPVSMPLLLLAFLAEKTHDAGLIINQRSKEQKK